MRMVSNVLPTLKFGDPIDTSAKAKNLMKMIPIEKTCITICKKNHKIHVYGFIKDIKAGEELCANYNLYTYPKTGVGIQML